MLNEPAVAALPRQLILVMWLPKQVSSDNSPSLSAVLMILQSAAFCRFYHHQDCQSFDYTPMHHLAITAGRTRHPA